MWITSLLGKPLFSPCSIHEGTKNQRRFYCIDCDSIVCKCCISTDPHNQHKFLQIHKYSHTTAIWVEDIKKHFDCSKIQAYRCNGQKVNILIPLHRIKGFKNESCKSCQRKLFEAKLYSYCSIACQLEARGLYAQPRRSSSSRRKGIPHRARM